MQAARRAPLNSGDTPEPENDPDIEPSEDVEPESGDEATKPARRTRFLLVFWGIALLGWSIDQITKRWAETSLLGKDIVPVFGDWLGWRLTYNSGASFSIGTSFTEVLSVIAIVAVIVVLVLSLRLGSKGWAFGLGFLLAGVAGNLTDRLFRAPGVLEGHVVDFIALPNWPIFNVADICINIAAVLIIVQTIRGLRLNGTRHD